MKLPRLVLQVEISWYYSLVLSEWQYIVTQLSELGSYKLNMDMLFANTSGPSINLYRGVVWLHWVAN